MALGYLVGNDLQFGILETLQYAHQHTWALGRAFFGLVHLHLHTGEKGKGF